MFVLAATHSPDISRRPFHLPDSPSRKLFQEPASPSYKSKGSIILSPTSSMREAFFNDQQFSNKGVKVITSTTQPKGKMTDESGKSKGASLFERQQARLAIERQESVDKNMDKTMDELVEQNIKSDIPPEKIDLRGGVSPGSQKRTFASPGTQRKSVKISPAPSPSSQRRAPVKIPPQPSPKSQRKFLQNLSKLSEGKNDGTVVHLVKQEPEMTLTEVKRTSVDETIREIEQINLFEERSRKTITNYEMALKTDHDDVPFADEGSSRMPTVMSSILP
ncbi:unnamed protein product [Owenia fusiformis]|uniref:Uncharacterized protein n=1 Tax=Owenia fusiformis TaxID=6347 RepID=A0A8J1U6T0_OWEFU|nr:unnamed protein product [Owenia fusiformis]